jgi:hypothetical protein
VSALLAVTLFFAGPGVKLPSLAALAEVVRGGDEVEIERVARRIGEARLAKAALAGPHAERLAALRALPLVDDAWASLGPLVPVLADGDSEVADAAAKAVARIAERLTPHAVFSEEIPPDVPRSAAKELWAMAGRKEVRASSRATAVAAASLLRRQLKPVPPVEDALIDALLADPDATVRRAAVEALGPLAPVVGGAKPAITARLEKAILDGDPQVAAAAGVAICAGVPATVSRLPAEQSATLLGEPARARLRTLVADESTGLADRLDLIPCLRAFATLADRKALDVLARSTTDSIKRRARAYGGR